MVCGCARSGCGQEEAREEVARLQYKVQMLEQNAELNAEAVEAAEKTRRKNDVQARALCTSICKHRLCSDLRLYMTFF